MKHIIILSAFAFGFLTAYAQKINFEKSLTTATEKSRAENKPIFLFFGASTPVTDIKGLNDPEVVKTVRQNFIAYRAVYTDTAVRKLIRDYKIDIFPAYIFLDTKGGLLFQAFGNFTQPYKYTEMFTKAIFASKQTALAELDSIFRSGNYDKDFLKEYITRRKNLGIIDNADIIEMYVNFLPIGDLNKYEEILFILEAGPIADSKTYKLAHFNKKVIDSVYKTIPQIRRGMINAIILNNTMSRAIATKNFQMALAAAAYNQALQGKNYAQGLKMHKHKILQYYKAVKDTVNYFRQAISFYDQYYMNVSADSIDRAQQKLLKSAENSIAIRESGIDTLHAGRIKQYLAKISTFNMFATELNNAAWSFYIMGTKSPDHLAKAILWSKRSIELKPKSAYYDTLAHLQYRLGFYVEAESTQRTAIKFARSEKRNPLQMQKELVKIRNKSL